MASSRPARTGIPPLEWAAALLGLALVCATLAVMVWLGVTRGQTPARIAVQVETISAAGKSYVVTIRAVNSGGTTAADVTVEGELRGASGIVETSTMSFKYLAPHSERRGGLYFENDPRKFELTLRPKGYETP